MSIRPQPFNSGQIGTLRNLGEGPLGPLRRGSRPSAKHAKGREVRAGRASLSSDFRSLAHWRDFARFADRSLSFGTTPARFGAVQNSLRKVQADPDLFFHCQHCKTALVVNKSAAGLSLTCQKCGKLTPVPKAEEPSASAYAEEIRGKLTENDSQRAEVTGYINQLTIQLHRWQLRLQTLNERKAQLEKELGQR